jgi:hypothetical protein
MPVSRSFQATREALIAPWVLGYCFGMFDALAQRGNLDQYTEGLLLITDDFIELMSGGQPHRPDTLMLGADMVKKALDSQTDARDLQGYQTGGTDLFAWCADTSKSPLSLFNHLTSTVAPRRLSTLEEAMASPAIDRFMVNLSGDGSAELLGSADDGKGGGQPSASNAPPVTPPPLHQEGPLLPSLSVRS